VPHSIVFDINRSTVDIPIKIISIFISFHDSIYTFAYSAEERFFEEYQPIANNMFQSVALPLTLELE
jgi:hypothetical protein